MTWLRHKYHAIRTEYAGVKYASKKEARYAQELEVRKKAGEVIFFLRQVPFHLPGGVRYLVDFVEFRSDGTIHFIDVKGQRLPEYIAKKKMVEDLYKPVQIEEV